MARFKRRRTSGRRMFARKKSYSRRRGNGSLLNKLKEPMIGAGAVILYDMFLAPMIPLNGAVKDGAELGIGLLGMNKSGAIGSGARTLVTLNSYQLLNRAKDVIMGKKTLNGNSKLFDGGGY